MPLWVTFMQHMRRKQYIMAKLTATATMHMKALLHRATATNIPRISTTTRRCLTSSSSKKQRWRRLSRNPTPEPTRGERLRLLPSSSLSHSSSSSSSNFGFLANSVQSVDRLFYYVHRYPKMIIRKDFVAAWSFRKRRSRVYFNNMTKNKFNRLTQQMCEIPFLSQRRQHHRFRNRRTGQVGRRVYYDYHVRYGTETHPTRRWIFRKGWP